MAKEKPIPHACNPFGRLIHLRCWEVLPFLTFQRQRCIKNLCPKDPEFYTPLALHCQKGRTSQHWRCIKTSLPLLLRPRTQCPRNGLDKCPLRPFLQFFNSSYSSQTPCISAERKEICAFSSCMTCLQLTIKLTKLD